MLKISIFSFLLYVRNSNCRKSSRLFGDWNTGLEAKKKQKQNKLFEMQIVDTDDNY